MSDNCHYQVKYLNLLRPRTKIGTEFLAVLQEQRLALRLVRLFGISKMLSLTSIRDEIHRIIPKEGKET